MSNTAEARQKITLFRTAEQAVAYDVITYRVRRRRMTLNQKVAIGGNACVGATCRDGDEHPDINS